ncbi:ABC transporter permease subunit [Kaistia dalseonensis]|uniref:Spermidine/putrescine transport system permease protein n=1 Tax=Kaistia dalseonensis TaxID=410840 RepID=A0ABU0H9M3_9HYPH|nr:ABC transporter permease subunit [Kaistia dalseonensis]MCX5496385.1 ABC transporter permease subunit [Kaistia dalseonensis]MDQ0439006.1 putative spermidine/putrescine transport system permease protein [Kaistia dalseonensis]
MNGMDRNPWKTLLLLAPGVGFLAVMFGIPLAWGVLGSFGIGMGPAKIAGPTLAYYAKVFGDPRYLAGLRTSFYYGAMPVVVNLIVAIPLSLALGRSFVGRKLFNGLYKIPLAVPSIVVAFAMLTLFEQGGFFSRFLHLFDLTLPRLVRDKWGFGVIMAVAWKDIPFMTLIITGSFASVPTELVQAARALGASPLRSFLFVKLPLAMPGITAAILLSFIRSTGSFVIPDVLGISYPLPFSVLMYQAFRESNWPLVYAIGTTLMVASFIVLLLYYLLTARIGGRKTDGA